MPNLINLHVSILDFWHSLVLVQTDERTDTLLLTIQIKGARACATHMRVRGQCCLPPADQECKQISKSKYGGHSQDLLVFVK